MAETLGVRMAKIASAISDSEARKLWAVTPRPRRILILTKYGRLSKQEAMDMGDKGWGDLPVDVKAVLMGAG